MPDQAPNCPLCSRTFPQAKDSDANVPRHLDPHLGIPCPGAETNLADLRGLL